MNDFTLKTYLTTNLDIAPDVLNSIKRTCFTREYAKDDFLLRSNEHCSHTMFIERGLLKQYSIDEKGKEHILHFVPEGWFLTNIESVYFYRPTPYFIQALEPTRVAFIDETFIGQLENVSPSFRNFNNMLLRSLIRMLEERITMLMSNSAEERYQMFIKTYPDILLRVPQLLVASYLGITPESLSRIRRDLAKRQWQN